MKFFFHKDDRLSEQLFTRIAEACQGLIYVSEIDAPVTPYAAPADSMEAPNSLLRHTHRSADDHIEEIPFDQFFGRLTTSKDWHTEIETARAKKFLELQKLLEENLNQLKVYRLGTIRIDIFAVGQNASNRLMGVMTQAVET